jgi:hypothetical protein
MSRTVYGPFRAHRQARRLLFAFPTLFFAAIVCCSAHAGEPPRKHAPSLTWTERVLLNAFTREGGSVQIVNSLFVVAEADFDDTSYQILANSGEFAPAGGSTSLLWKTLKDFRKTLDGGTWSLIMVSTRIFDDESAKKDKPFEVLSKGCGKPGEFLKDMKKRGLLPGVDLSYLDKHRDECCVNFVIASQRPAPFARKDLSFEQHDPPRQITAQVTFFLAGLVDGKMEVRSTDVALHYKGDFKWEVANRR